MRGDYIKFIINNYNTPEFNQALTNAGLEIKKESVHIPEQAGWPAMDVLADVVNIESIDSIIPALSEFKLGVEFHKCEDRFYINPIL